MIANYQWIQIVPFGDLWSIVLVAFIIIGTFCGILGSCLSLRKYLRV